MSFTGGAAMATGVVLFLAQQDPPAGPAQNETHTMLRGGLVLLLVALALIAMVIWWMKRNA